MIVVGILAIFVVFKLFNKFGEEPNELTEKFENITKEQIKQVKETDPARILFEIENQELKTELIKKHGMGNLLKKLNPIIRHGDDCGKLFKVTHDGVDYHFVEVVNGSPEPDGTFKEYYLQVPPDMDTAKEAVAWTYGLTEDEYDLAIRT